MMRHKQCVYHTKLGEPKSRVLASNQSSAQSTASAPRHGYINSALISHEAALSPYLAVDSSMSKIANSGIDATKRHHTKPSGKIRNGKNYANEILVGKDDCKSVTKITKIENPLGNVYGDSNHKSCHKATADDKGQPQHHYHYNHNNHQHNSNEDINYDDAAEFFDLIRRTVENAIQKSISELVNHNFKEVDSKFKKISNDLKNTNELLRRLETDLNNKISHYGEENSRHFQFLCMKSEYDKLFYQHRSLTDSQKSSNDDISPQARNVKGRGSCQKWNKKCLGVQEKKGDNTSAAASYIFHSMMPEKQFSNIRKSLNYSSEDVSQKSSETMQNMFDQIKLNALKVSRKSAVGPEIVQQQNSIKTNHQKRFDECDEEEAWQTSSDDMTPRNRSNAYSHKIAANANKDCIIKEGNNGAGDG